jgi:hypothetical protein
MARNMLRRMHETSFITSSSHVIRTPQENLRVVKCYSRLCQRIESQDGTHLTKSLSHSQAREFHHHASISHAPLKARDMERRLQHLLSKVLSIVASCSTAAAMMGSSLVRGRKSSVRECCCRIEGKAASMARGYRLSAELKAYDAEMESAVSAHSVVGKVNAVR